jgi:hypothetical protein
LLGAHGGIGNLPLGIGGDVQPPRPSAHRSIYGIEPSIQPMRLVSIREAAVLHALLDVGTPDFRCLAPWNAFVHLTASQAHPDFSRRGKPSFTQGFLLAPVAKPKRC